MGKGARAFSALRADIVWRGGKRATRGLGERVLDVGSAWCLTPSRPGRQVEGSRSPVRALRLKPKYKGTAKVVFDTKTKDVYLKS